ncbi:MULTISPECIES: PIG-L family deacetylase [Microbacterium]|jgi:LmbE family N-acetylglucosaminyl deacetylase|uniref:PIG-L family deacetylase n=1 Tax=Microbacterium TaxID=33882 RepID=UPI001D17185F|nr:PIG-L family deacetylase [Microbacterium testaceum]MCC4248522.1 PIG-L family deacetylase [Microbacterium testaceum]
MTRVDRSTPLRARLGAGALIAALAVVLLVGGSIVVSGALGVWPVGAATRDAAPLASGRPTAAPTFAPIPRLAPAVTTPPPTVAPAPMVSLSPAAQPCESDTLLTVWAHPDDDIIFGNPAISGALSAGQCVRTAFLTSGDAGKGLTYTRSRELGILRAYNHMRGADGLWDSTVVTLDAGLRVERLTPQGDPRVSIMFVRLPDGNITDGGFDATGHATLSKLIDGGIGALAPIDGGPAVDRAQLSAALTEIASALQPARTLTHVPRGSAFAAGDHPDHSAVGTLVRDAIGQQGPAAAGIRYVVGYPSQDLPRTLDGAVLDAKVDTYRIYAQQDEVVRCADRAACLKTRKFGEWLRRSYLLSEAELRLS